MTPREELAAFLVEHQETLVKRYSSLGALPADAILEPVDMPDSRYPDREHWKYKPGVYVHARNYPGILLMGRGDDGTAMLELHRELARVNPSSE